VQLGSAELWSIPVPNNGGENQFSSQAVEMLSKAGWYPGRVVDEERLQEFYVIRWDPGTSIDKVEGEYYRPYTLIFPAAK
jgi:hypothetical protein